MVSKQSAEIKWFRLLFLLRFFNLFYTVRRWGYHRNIIETSHNLAFHIHETKHLTFQFKIKIIISDGFSKLYMKLVSNDSLVGKEVPIEKMFCFVLLFDCLFFSQKISCNWSQLAKYTFIKWELKVN